MSPAGRAPLALLVAALVLLGGCTSGRTPDQAATPKQRLAHAATALDRTTGVRIALTTTDLPDGVSGLLAARGVGNPAPAFRGELTVAAGGSQVKVPVISVDGKVHAQLPFTDTYLTVDPAQYNAPDPAELMAPRTGLSSLVRSATKLTAGKRVRDGKVVLTELRGVVPGAAVARVLPSSDPTADFRATFALDDRDRLVRATIRGPFYPQAPDVTYTLTFTDYGSTPRITAP